MPRWSLLRFQRCKEMRQERHIMVFLCSSSCLRSRNLGTQCQTLRDSMVSVAFLNLWKADLDMLSQGFCSVRFGHKRVISVDTDRNADSIGFFPQMICAAIAGLLLFMSIAHKALAEIHAREEEVEEKARMEALPKQKGLERLRRQGSSVDFRHARQWSSRAAFPSISVPEEVDGY